MCEFMAARVAKKKRVERDGRDFCTALREWFGRHGRELPWRETTDAYAVVVSEFMLQQTTVAAVVPYYRRWMERWPTIELLAEATEHDVLLLWQGLGYYSRARNLLAAARVVVEKYGGVFPSEPETLKKLPGFGDYTAGAVAAFAYDRAVVVIDANIARVLARLANVRVPVGAGKGRGLIEAWLQEKLRDERDASCPGKTGDPLVPCVPSVPSGGRVIISALMDIGATVCRSGVPRCDVCPVHSFCTATNPAELPVKPPRREIVSVTEYRALIVRNGNVALCPASETGKRWRGLWVLPETQGRDADHILHTEKFAVTHHRITMYVVKRSARGGERFFSLAELPPMPAAHLRTLRVLA